MKSNPEKARYWRQHIEAFQASGLSRREYCEKNQIKITTLDYWRHRFRIAEANIESGWIPVKITEDGSAGIDLRIGRITIAVKSGFDPALLKELLHTIGAQC